MNSTETGTGTRLYEARFRDAITQTLTASSQPGCPVETTLAEALRKLFFAAPVHVIWQTKDQATGASCPDMRSPARAFTDRDRVREIQALAEPLTTARTHPRIVVCPSQEDAPAWGLVLASPQAASQLWVVVEVPRDKPVPELLTWFSQYTQGLQEFHTAVVALMALKVVQRDAEYAQLARRTGAITSGGERTHTRDLEAATRVLRELGEHAEPLEPRRLGLASDLAVWATQSLLGIGWGGRAIEGAQGQLRLEAFCAQLDHLAARARAEGVGKPAELAAMSGILRATLPEPEFYDPGERTQPSVDPALGLLVTWTGIHELCRRVADNLRAPSAEDDARWEAASTRGVPDLSALLEKRSLVDTPDAAFVRNWARLWFCLLLLRAGGEWWRGGTLLDDDKWRFRRDLSYVLRESIRSLVYGHRDDYKYQPSSFAEALRTLVEQHALRVVGLPREIDVRTHLREIGEVHGPEGYHFAAGHLQHILEIYIGGHFLASLMLEAAPDATEEEKQLDGWRMAEVLASRSGWRPGTQTTAELLASFSLAALFHDTGMLLFPRYSRPTPTLSRNDPRLEGALGDVEAAFSAAGSALISRCVDDLKAADFLDTTADPSLARWLEDQVQSGAPDHALLGAWYLYRVGRGAPALSSDALRDALRAVLLHSLHALPVDVERDPITALLVLCDEMFEWEPSVRPGPQAYATGRSLGAMAADVRPRRSRARTVQISGLRVVATADGELTPILRLEPRDVAHGWPRIHLRLHLPERLEVPVYGLWLTMGQNLGRIERSRHGWGPGVVVTSAIPARLRAAGLNTRRLMGLVTAHLRHPARASLERWLMEVGQFSVDETEGVERVRLDAHNHVLYTEDIRRVLGPLTEEAERVLREFERRARP